jgi:hypothetical protein
MAKSHVAKGSGYFPAASQMEGGFTDRRGKPLHTLQDFLGGKASFVSTSMDKFLSLGYGTKLTIPELDKRFGAAIEFRVVDTGDAFDHKGYSRIDICVRDRAASLDAAINGTLTLTFP